MQSSLLIQPRILAASVATPSYLLSVLIGPVKKYRRRHEIFANYFRCLGFDFRVSACDGGS